MEDNNQRLSDYFRKLLVDNLRGKKVVPLVPLEDIPGWPAEFNEGKISSVNPYFLDKVHLEVTFRRRDGSPAGHLCDIFYSDFTKYRIE